MADGGPAARLRYMRRPGAPGRQGSLYGMSFRPLAAARNAEVPPGPPQQRPAASRDRRSFSCAPQGTAPFRLRRGDRGRWPGQEDAPAPRSGNGGFKTWCTDRNALRMRGAPVLFLAPPPDEIEISLTRCGQRQWQRRSRLVRTGWRRNTHPGVPHVGTIHARRHATGRPRRRTRDPP